MTKCSTVYNTMNNNKNTTIRSRTPLLIINKHNLIKSHIHKISL